MADLSARLSSRGSLDLDIVLDDEDLEFAPAGAPATDTDLVLDDDDLDAPQPVFQTGLGDTSMVAKEADKETAGSAAGLEAPSRASGASAHAIDTASSDGKPTAKVVLVGNSGVGKTSLLVRFSQDLFRDAGRPATVGVDLHTREVALDSGSTLSLQLWDTAGQEQFNALTTSYFRNAHAVVLAYDVHEPASFAALNRWMLDVDRLAPAEVVKVIVGLKCDAGAGAATAVSTAEATEFAQKHGALSERCSAKQGTGIFTLFEHLGEKLVRSGFDPDGTRARRRSSKAGLAGGAKGKKKAGCC